MKAAVIYAIFIVLSGVDTASSSSSKQNKKKQQYDPETFFVGMWEGIDPLDGASIQRSIVPSLDPESAADGDYEFTGKIEYSQICGADVVEVPDGEPPATSNLVPALLNSIAQVTDDGMLTIAANLTCFGDEEARLTGIPAFYKPLSPNLMLEVPSFRSDSPIVLHRMSKDFEEYFD